MEKLTLWRAKSLARGVLHAPVMQKGALLTSGDCLVWVGEEKKLPKLFQNQIEKTFDFEGCMTPGLIDCHTHLVYAGHRAYEFEQRLEGQSYEAIAKAGGGIQSTVSQTQSVSELELFEETKPRLQAMCQAGVTTVEIKSGYGLDFETERKMLRVAHQLAEYFPVTIQKTYLGLHKLPKQYQSNRASYLKEVLEQILPKLVKEKLVDTVDAFCENIAFDAREVGTFFDVAKNLNLPIKLHAEQLSDSKGVELAIKYNALSVDHLEHLTDTGIRALASSQTVAVLLPTAYYYLQAQKKPPVAQLREKGIPMAIATDCNPGTSPTTSLLLAMNMSAVLFGLTPEEAFVGATLHAAKAMGLEKTYGSLEAHKYADFVVWDIEHPRELVAGIGMNPCHTVIKHGKIVYEADSF